MNVRPRVALRPRTTGELLDLSLRYMRRVVGRPLLWIALWSLSPPFLLTASLRVLGDLDWPLVWLCAWGSAFIAQGPLTMAMGDALFADRDISSRDVLLRYLRLLPKHLAALFMTWGMGLLFALTVVLAPIAATNSLFATEACVLEGLAPSDVPGRARRFVAGERVEFAGYLAATWGMAAGLAFASYSVITEGLTFVLQLDLPGASYAGEFGDLYMLFAFFAVQPFLAAARYLKYIDARTRRDGWDVQFRFQALAATSARLREREGDTGS